MKRIAVIMAGGAGERFWPLSRQKYPKQLLKIAGNRSMLGAAVERVSPIVDPADTYIITGKSLQEAIQAECQLVAPGNVIAEPEGKNTAACLALASAMVQQRYAAEPDVVMIVLTADHFIRDTEAFTRDCTVAASVAETSDALVTFGIPPDRPETGYGYVEIAEPMSGTDNVFAVASFREKPDPETARAFVSSGRFLWNSGMFVWRNSVLQTQFAKHLPDMFAQFPAMRNAFAHTGQDRHLALAAVFAGFRKISIDYGVLEKAESVYCVRASFDWDDIGTWGSISRLLQSDEHGNVSFGQARLLDCENTIVYSATPANDHEHPIVVGLGLKDLIIVRTPDAILVLPEEQAQNVRQVVNRLRDEGLMEYL